MKRKFDEHVTKPNTFAANSYVLIRNETPKKSASKWLGPYRVRSEQPILGTYELEDCHNKRLLVCIHANRLIQANIGAFPPTEPRSKIRLQIRVDNSNGTEDTIEDTIHATAAE